MLYIHIHVYCIYTIYTYIHIYTIYTTLYSLGWLLKNQKITNAGEDVEKLELLYTYDVHYRKQYDISSKNKVYDVYLLCEMYFLSLKIFIFVSFRKKIKELP